LQIVRDRLGKKLGLAVLVASNLLNLIICAAEMGGVAIVRHLLTGWPEKPLLTAVALAFGFLVAVLRFEWIERIFGLAGVTMVIAAVSAWMLGPDWRGLSGGLVPHRAEGPNISFFGPVVARAGEWYSFFNGGDHVVEFLPPFRWRELPLAIFLRPVGDGAAQPRNAPPEAALVF
jgi:hypothetical protein